MNDLNALEPQSLFGVEPGTPAAPEISPKTTPEDAPNDLKKRPFIRWRKLLTLAAVYTATETALDLSGLDTLADYSEFIQNGQAALQVVGETIVNLAHLIL